MANKSPTKSEVLSSLEDTRTLAYEKFWNEEAEAAGEGDFIEVTEGFVRLYGDLRHLKSLYVRQCYRELDLIIEEYYNNGSTTNIIVTGTPGVGKSMFLLYQLIQAKKRKRNVLLQIGSRISAFLSSPSVVFTEIRDGTKHSLLENSQTMFLYDPAERREGPIGVLSAFTIVFASTWEGNFRALVKSQHVKLYMPIWTKEELVVCGAACHPSISKETILKLEEKWGGSPRSIFVTTNSNEERLQTFLASKALGDVIADMEHVSMSARPNDAHQWLVHIVVTSQDYQSFFEKWPSQYIMREVHRVLVEARSYEKQENSTSNLKWRSYENSVIHDKLALNQAYTATNIGTGAKETIPPTSEFKYFTNTSELNPADMSTLYVPCEANKKTLDSLKGNWLFQITLAKTHTINIAGLRAVSTATGITSWNLCFCIPEARFEEFSKQKFSDPCITVKQYKIAFY